MKENTKNGYSSPSIELLALACEQAFLSGSTCSIGETDNEEFTDGGTYTGGWM